MTITAGRRFFQSESSPGGSTTFWTPNRSHDVGSLANRVGGAMVYWTVSNRGDPTGFEVGTDVLTKIGSSYTQPSGGRLALFRGPLTVTGAQNLRAQFTAITDFDSGNPAYLFWVVEADGTITISGDLSLLQHTFGGGGGTVSRDVTSGTGHLVLLASVDYGGAGPTATGAGGTTLITGSNNLGAVGYIAGASPTATAQISYTTFTQGASCAFSVSEASSGATATTLSGPSSGTVGVASSNFTVGANGAITGTVTVTPSDGGAGGTFTPTSVNISSGTPTATFTYTAASTGAKTISTTNNGGLSNPSNLTYTASNPAATSMTIALKQADGTTAAASVTGIQYAILNAATLGAATAVLDTGTGESTDGSGNLVLDVTGLGLVAGDVRYVIAGKSAGTVGADFDGWHGPATAAA